jgi:hypothetical protein
MQLADVRYVVSELAGLKGCLARIALRNVTTRLYPLDRSRHLPKAEATDLIQDGGRWWRVAGEAG